MKLGIKWVLGAVKIIGRINTIILLRTLCGTTLTLTSYWGEVTVIRSRDVTVVGDCGLRNGP